MPVLFHGTNPYIYIVCLYTSVINMALRHSTMPVCMDIPKSWTCFSFVLPERTSSIWVETRSFTWQHSMASMTFLWRWESWEYFYSNWDQSEGWSISRKKSCPTCPHLDDTLYIWDIYNVWPIGPRVCYNDFILLIRPIWLLLWNRRYPMDVQFWIMIHFSHKAKCTNVEMPCYILFTFTSWLAKQ